MTSPADDTMNIDSGDNHTQHASREPKAERPFDATTFNSDVCNAIAEQMEVSGAQIPPFQDPEALQNDDSAILFNIILKAYLGESPLTVEMCKTVLLCCGDLKSELNKAYVNKSFNDILLHPNMPLQVLERVPKKEPTISPSSSGGIKDDQVLGVKAGFERPYIGNAAERFIRTLNREREAFGRNTAVNNPYNFAISVVQSSGTGKSRMVQEAAKTVFTIPINIRQESKVAERAYPPPDRSLRGFFEDRVNYDDDQQKADYMVLLTVIFDKTQEIIQQLFRGSTGAALAHEWARYLGTDETDIEVGKLRKDFYDDVVETATHICRHSVPNLVKLELSLQTSCKRLVATVQPVLDNTNACFMYFDEAHLLTQEIETPSETHQRNPFHNLGNVLSKLVNYRIFFIFLSTNSSLKGFAPPASYYTSQRSIDGSQLVAPYIELPFDINAVTPVDAEHPPTLESASKVGHMVQYGRALWTSMWQTSQGDDIFRFAMDKISANGQVANEKDSIDACLGVRVGYTFDGKLSYSKESKLVESHMRVATAIPKHREFLHSTSPSEPILAEAAGRFLSSEKFKGLAIEGPKAIARALEDDFLARGERGELDWRLKLTIAHDEALKKLNGPPKHLPNKPYFHVPIPFMTFLEALFHKSHHKKIREATSITGRDGIPRLAKAFRSSYVFFSHFALAADPEMLSPFGLATALVRGMALQARDGQASIDAVIPVHIGKLTDRISPESTSAINMQVKNRKSLARVSIDRSITVPDFKKPVLSIIVELGVTGKHEGLSVTKTKPSSRETRSKTSAELGPNDYHYEIVARGCSSKLFGFITDDLEATYRAILGAGTFLEDFARCDEPDNVEGLWEMKPAFRGADQEKEWVKAKAKAPNPTT